MCYISVADAERAPVATAGPRVRCGRADSAANGTVINTGAEKCAYAGMTPEDMERYGSPDT